ncbi:MAG: hypothetical protein GY809_21070 [Planctomycetes bacterium]|nr:hypothetical protein [Planctomycetota bacterium]
MYRTVQAPIAYVPFVICLTRERKYLVGSAIGKDACTMTRLAEDESKAMKRVRVEMPWMG